MADDSPSSPASYIRLVQHLIEKCICYNMDKEECVRTLEKQANIMPTVTSTVWKELEKENRDFFEAYKKEQGDQKPSQKTSCTPSEQEASVSKSSDDSDN